MHVVTALRATRRGGVALHVDEDYVCVVSENVVARWRLFKGRELAADDVAQIRAAASAERAAGDAYRLLAHRARSREELRRRLLAKEHDPAAVDDVVERLATEGLIDDAAFARSYTADKRRLAGWGDERIRRGLLQLGVASHAADDALSTGDGEEDELDRALAVLRRRGAPGPPLEAARRRAFQMLRRRGFSTSISYTAVGVWMEHPDQAPN